MSRQDVGPFATSAAVAGLTLAVWAQNPVVLAFVAWYSAWCPLRPEVMALTFHLSPLALALLLPLALTAAGAGVWSVVDGVRATVSLRRRIRLAVRPLPERLRKLALAVGLPGRVAYLEEAPPLAFCYGLARPAVCISAGLMALLSSAELRAVLLHERSHLRRHDPLRLLMARALAKALFFLPVAGQLKCCYALALELRADRAALQEVPRATLASTLMRLLSAAETSPRVAAGFSLAAERAQVLVEPGSSLPLRLSPTRLFASLAMLFLLVLVSVDLAALPHWLLAPCHFCPFS